MINKTILLFAIIFFCLSCGSRIDLKKPVILSYSNKDVSVDIELVSKQKINLSNKKDNWGYFYYGTFTSQLKDLNKDPKEIRLEYKEKETFIYLDTIASVDFWRGKWWDVNGFRKNKVYVVFSEDNVDWDSVKFLEYEIKKPMTREEVCSKLISTTNKSYCE